MEHDVQAKTESPRLATVLPERPLRIAFLDSWLQQVIDGSGTAAAIGGLEQALIRRGHRVTRITPRSNWPHVLTLRRLLYNLQLPALLRTLSYDLIVGFDIDGFLWAGRTTKTPYICSVKGVIAEELRHETGNVRRTLWSMSRLEMLNARRAPLVLTTSDYCRQKIHEHYGVASAKIRLVPEGIDLPRWRDMFYKTDVARDPFTVLCVARQYPRKHIADLLHAFVQVKEEVPFARLIIIGDGPDHEFLLELARSLKLEGIARFMGGLPDAAEVMAWYKRSAVFCLPSVQEGFGIVFLEAMASGIPIVATTAAAIPEVVPHRQAGILVPPASPAALAEALLELLENPVRCAEYGSFGQHYVEQFTWDRVAERFLAAVADRV
ncbi:MAG: glycosyltransferase family 4 protein [Chloroflexaceae bacterium]|nr:glycosyltransferase family 4 protein [Chloroflexaceae bacterium]